MQLCFTNAGYDWAVKMIQKKAAEGKKDVYNILIHPYTDVYSGKCARKNYCFPRPQSGKLLVSADNSLF